MVTREFESGRVQSHNYWKEAEYGGINLQVVEEVTLDARGREVKMSASMDQNKGGNFFPVTDCGEGDGTASASTIRRRFALSKGGETRYIVHLQFVAWPDFSIPDDAEGILDYIQMANKEQHRAEVELRTAQCSSEVGPLVVHCSAGVGRTGTYVVIDSVLDALRRARRRDRHQREADVWDDEVDGGKRTETDGTKDVNMASEPSSKPNPLAVPISLPRKSLKRELSPSAMDIDSADYGQMGSSPSQSNSNGAARHGSSPPPLRRGRSDEIDEASTLSLSSLKSSFTFSPPASSLTSPPSSGLDTPSGAMDNMRITWDSSSPHTPIKTKQIKSAHLTGKEQGTSSINSQGTFAAMPINKITTAVIDESTDLVQQAVEIIREQRMSTVQTGRQYVFAYRAIIEGILREAKMERSSSKRIDNAATSL